MYRGLSEKGKLNYNFATWVKTQKVVKTKNNKLLKKLFAILKNASIKEMQRSFIYARRSSSEKEHKVNALASGADEGRD